MSEIDPRSAALVLIDLQNGIVGLPLAPREGREIVAAAKAAATTFRAAGAGVVLVRVGWASDFADAPSRAVDKPMDCPPDGFPPGWGEIVDGLVQPGDLVVTKHHWGALHGTELDLQLRRRGIRTVVLGGIATNFGVESTARQAWEHGYDVVLLEDLCTSVSADLHEMSILHVLPRIARVRRVGSLKLIAS